MPTRFNRTVNAILASIILTMPVAAADMIAEDPLSFVPQDGWLELSEINELLKEGAFWCFFPQGNSCDFTVLATGYEGEKFLYDVVELWDNDIILTSPTGGILYEDGRLCEFGIEFIENIRATDREFNPVSDAQLSEMKRELRASWVKDKDVEYCFTYARLDAKKPEKITQFLYENGKLFEKSMPFIMDYRANAASSYELRLD